MRVGGLDRQAAHNLQGPAVVFHHERAMANNEGSGDVTTMVCVTCGAEQFFDDVLPATLTCPTCQSTVFRQFTTPTRRDDATIARLEEQARSTSYGDASPGTSPDDVRDLEST